MPPSPTIPYLHIPESHGLFLPPSTSTTPPNSPTHIGTHSCQTCIALYLPLLPSPTTPRAFAAHINAYIYSTHFSLRLRVACTDAEGIAMQTHTISKLHKTGLTRGSIDIQNVIIVCPNLYTPDGGKRPGWYVVQGILEFMGWPEGVCCDEEAQGFVVELGEGGSVVMVSKELKREERETWWLEGKEGRRYEMRVVEGKEEEWKIWTERKY